MLALVGIIFLIVYYAWSMIFGSKIMPEPIVNPLTIFHIAAPKKISVEPITVSAISAVAFDEQSGARIFDQNADAVRPIASLTKLMTVLVFLDNNANHCSLPGVVFGELLNSLHYRPCLSPCN